MKGRGGGVCRLWGAGLVVGLVVDVVGAEGTRDDAGMVERVANSGCEENGGGASRSGAAAGGKEKGRRGKLSGSAAAIVCCS